MTKFKMPILGQGSPLLGLYSTDVGTHTLPKPGEQQQNVRDDLGVSSKGLVTGGGTLCTVCLAAVQNYRVVLQELLGRELEKSC